MNGQKLLVAAFVIAFGIIVWQEVSANQFPRPKRLASAGVAFFILGLVSTIGAPGLAGALGIGLDLALFFQLDWNKLTGTTAAPPVDQKGKLI